jgi:hypothetical protein
MSMPLTDLELELAKARSMARVMDAILGLSTYEQDVTCPLCGQRELRHSRDPKAPAAVMAVCRRCSEQ